MTPKSRLRYLLPFLVLIILISTPVTVKAFTIETDDTEFINQFVNPPTVNFDESDIWPTEVADNFWQDSMLTARQLTRRQEGLDLRGYIPVVDPSFGFGHLFLNAHIEDEIVVPFISEARGRARSITFSHDVYVANGVVSIVIFAEIATAIPHTLVRSVNFDTLTGELLCMNAALNLEVSPLIMRKLDEMFRSDPASFNTATTVDPEALAFYLTHTELVLLFDGFSLSSRDGEVTSLTLSRSGIRTYTLFADEYVLSPAGYNLKLLPLRRVVENLGYLVEWFPETERVEVWLNGSLVIEFYAFDNNYVVSGIMQITLETPPMLVPPNGSMYVPITFFDQVLPLTVYTISPEGNITFLAYQN